MHPIVKSSIFISLSIIISVWISGCWNTTDNYLKNKSYFENKVVTPPAAPSSILPPLFLIPNNLELEPPEKDILDMSKPNVAMN